MQVEYAFTACGKSGARVVRRFSAASAANHELAFRPRGTYPKAMKSRWIRGCGRGTSGAEALSLTALNAGLKARTTRPEGSKEFLRSCEGVLHPF